MAARETIAVLGAGGTMGRGLAQNLSGAGFEVRAWNRSPGKAVPLTEHGVRLLDTPAQAAQGAGTILTIVSDAEAVVGCMEGEAGALAAPLREDTIWLQMSTIGEEGTERCIALARDQGLEFVDAPVLGTKQPALRGELVILASGPDRLHDRLAPVFDAVGERTIWVGGAGDGTRLKLAVNSWVLTVVEGGAETLALAESMGLDPRLVLDALQGGPLDLPYLQIKGRAMIERDFEDASFRLALAAKDAALVEAAATARGLDLPVLSAIRRRLAQGVPAHGDEDMSATFLTSVTSGAPA